MPAPTGRLQRSAPLAAMDLDAISRMHAAAGHAPHDPLGWPIDPGAEQRENPALMRASDLLCGERAEVRRLAHHPQPLIAHLLADGVRPGASLEVLEDGQITGLLRVRINDRDTTIAATAAAALWTLPCGS